MERCRLRRQQAGGLGAYLRNAISHYKYGAGHGGKRLISICSGEKAKVLAMVMYAAWPDTVVVAKI